MIGSKYQEILMKDISDYLNGQFFIINKKTKEAGHWSFPFACYFCLRKIYTEKGEGIQVNEEYYHKNCLDHLVKKLIGKKGFENNDSSEKNKN